MGFNQKFVYDISHIGFTKATSKKDIVGLLQEHEPEQFAFSFNTAAISCSIGKELGIINPIDLKLIFESGLFHDTGKLGMTPEFINYPSSYTLSMYNEMKKHPQGGGIILEKINAESQIVEAARFHHCNYDGSGYPGDLFGKEIPLSARITRVADSLDAYLSKRCYKEGGPANEALDDLNQYIGSSYDPEIIECFANIHRKVMKQCHLIGEDRPSQNMYMHFIIKLYLYDFPAKKPEDILEIV